MCGIFGAILNNKKDAGQVVLNGLKRLEYRGYDSWGIAASQCQSSNDKCQILVEKYIGKIGGVEKLNLPASQVAIGHTRWATHGGVTDYNAHPHLASDRSFAVVQNGVVENYQELKKELESQGYEFQSETDTEVIVGLLEAELVASSKRTPNNAQLTTEIVSTVYQRLEGRSTVVIMTNQGDVFAFRNGSPLVVGRGGDGSLYLSSDVLALSEVADEFVQVGNGFGLVSSIDLKLFDISTLQESELDWQPIELDSVVLDKGGFDHFMLKEIHEQSQVLSNVMQVDEMMMSDFVKKVREADQVFIVGAGSASFVAEYIALQLRQKGIKALAVKSYESKSYLPLATSHSLAIFISQSGETADTNEVVEWMREKGVTIASIVNMPGSTLSQMSDHPFMLQVGPEVAVASTKAMIGQMMWGWGVSQLVGGKKLADVKRLIAGYENDLDKWLQVQSASRRTKVQSIIEYMMGHDHMFVLGRGELYPSALEFALKMKEISYIHAEGFSGGELKHGVIALIEEGTPVVCLIAQDDEREEMLNAVAQIKARGAYVIGVSVENNDLFDDWIEIIDNPEFVAMSAIIPSQLMTYCLALAKGLDPDKPRNLAKSVTVK